MRAQCHIDRGGAASGRRHLYAAVLLISTLPVPLALLAGCAATGPTPVVRAGTRPAAPFAPAPTPAHLVAAPDVPGDPDRGRQLFIATGCGGCHTIAGVSGADGTAAPNLTNVVLRPTLAGESIPMSPETMRRWLLDPASVKPGTPMPNLGLSPEQAQDLTAFLFSQPYNPPG